MTSLSSSDTSPAQGPLAGLFSNGKRFCSTIQSKMSPELVAHVAIIAALVGAVFFSVLNGNLVFTFMTVAGLAGEGYLAYKIYAKHHET